ncbi:alpha/beta fold hydrolase [Streptomyces coeruleoprunus]|uniref:Alpha/beta fold hydrolase n=1 Tax=Streptomyces coeruleoprunus TaxID=285563 RepID=A0ABV9XBK5_9ACTN
METVSAYHDGVLGRMRSRAVGRPAPGVPEVVLVQGMGVADYLLPGLAAFARWTRAHLVELPGFGGSGEPPHELDVPEFGRCVADWLTAQDVGRVVLVGHSSGTQVAARAAVGHPAVAAVVLASPTVDPVARGRLRLLVRWRLDGRREPPGLSESHRPEWKRAGLRRLLHTARAHLADDLEDAVARLRVPLLVIHGRDDLIGTTRWARHLSGLVADGTCVEVPGAHTFPWLDPEAWSEPVRQLAVRVAEKDG